MLKSAELIVAMHGKIPQATWPSLTTSQLFLTNKNINNAEHDLTLNPQQTILKL